jgi:hypothetical protein
MINERFAHKAIEKGCDGLMPTVQLLASMRAEAARIIQTIAPGVSLLSGGAAAAR